MGNKGRHWDVIWDYAGKRLVHNGMTDLQPDLQGARLGSERGGLEMADGGGGEVFDGMVQGYRVEELINSRVEDGSSECCISVSNS